MLRKNFQSKQIGLVLAWLALLGLLVSSFYIALRVLLEIHWLSEALAGTIIGSVIGVVAGKYF